MLKIYVNEKEENAVIETQGSLKSIAIETIFAISEIYKTMLEDGRKSHAHEYRELLEGTLSEAFDGVDRLLAMKQLKDRPSEEIQELLDEIMKRRR